MRRLLWLLVWLVMASTAWAQPSTTKTGLLTATTCDTTLPIGQQQAGCVLFNVTGMGTAGVQISGTFSGTLTFTGSVLGSGFNNVGCTSTAAGQSAVNSTTSTGQFQCTVAGLGTLKVAFSSYTSGSARIDLLASTGGGGAGGGGGGGGGGAVTVADGADVALGTTTDPKNTATDATSVTAISILKEISAMEQAPASRAVTGTVTANAGTNLNTSALSTSANQTNASQKTQIVDGSGNVIASTSNAMNVQLANGSATATVGGTSNVALVSFVGTDPCQSNAKVFVGIGQTAGATIITGTSAKKIYICSFNLVAADAENIAVVEGTGTVCATGISTVPGLNAGTTAANGWNFAANGGIVVGSGAASVAGTTVNADNLCILQSGSGRVSGGIGYVVQ